MKGKEKKMNKSRFKGIALVIFGATLWGISGTVAEFLFQKNSFTTEWLVVVRLLLSGIWECWVLNILTSLRLNMEMQQQQQSYNIYHQ